MFPQYTLQRSCNHRLAATFHHDVIACLCSVSYAMSSSLLLACRANKDFRSMSGGQGLLVALQPVLLSSRHPKVEAISKNYQQEDAIQKNPFKSLFLTVTVASSERDLCSDTAGLQTAQPELC
ncbi:TPA: hypothetical protein ACH3X1_010849 [Trebouxia sp. C0004]